ncbi:MAG TPA: hypothetical protein DEQ78_05070 [Ruminococcaceae bacterium]|nr:hypothetical protein [Oscillospiraceae bacterium]HCE26634.1 hypothetical protein [Oscillospiraceae bacterium]
MRIFLYTVCIMIIMRKPLKKGIKRLKIIHQIYFTRKTEKNQGFFRQNVKITSKIFALLQNRLNSGILKFMYG